MHSDESLIRAGPKSRKLFGNFTLLITGVFSTVSTGVISVILAPDSLLNFRSTEKSESVHMPLFKFARILSYRADYAVL